MALLLANSGHFDVEINKPALRDMSIGEPKRVRPFVEQFTLKDGRKTEPAGRRALDQPGRGRRTPGGGDGHELCRPGDGREVPCRQPGQAGEQGLYHS